MNTTFHNPIPPYARKMLSQYSPAIRDEIVAACRDRVQGDDKLTWDTLHDVIAIVLNSVGSQYRPIPDPNPEFIKRAHAEYDAGNYLTTKGYLNAIRSRMASGATNAA